MVAHRHGLLLDASGLEAEVVVQVVQRRVELRMQGRRCLVQLHLDVLVLLCFQTDLHQPCTRISMACFSPVWASLAACV